MLPSEARRADSGGWVLEEEAASPLPTSKRGWGPLRTFPTFLYSEASTQLMLLGLRVNSYRTPSVC